MTRSVAIRKLLARRPNKSDMLGIFLLLFPFIALLTPLTQVTTDYQSPFYQLLFYYKLISLVVILFLYVNQGSLSSFDKSVLIFLGVWAIAVFINSNDISSVVNEMGAIIFYCCMFGYYVRKSPAGFLFVYFICLGFMLFLNLFYLIVYPDGLFQTDSIWNSSRINFLGLDNQISPLLFIWFILFYLARRIGYYRKVINVFGVLVICGNTIMLNVGTLYTAALLFMLSMFLYRRVPKLFRMKAALLIIFIVFLSIVLLRLQYLFEFFIVDILNKDITLTGRLVIWDEAIMLFSNQPFFGYGLSSIGW
ncbi:MAG TPA: O-antigen ligase family protein, partial [Sphingobacterium sp.]|nr:O-antigen ligase family protein [Sphingobacterium sp.]